MRSHPENIEQLKSKHNFNFLFSDKELKTIKSDVILRHDISFLFLKNRIFSFSSKQPHLKESITLESKIKNLFSDKDRVKVYNDFEKVIPFYIEELEKPKTYYLLIFTIFLIPWILYIIKIIKDRSIFAFAFTLLHPEFLYFLLIFSVLLLMGYDYTIGRVFKKKLIPDEYKELSIKNFINKIINKNRDEIKNKFETLFSDEIEMFNNKASETQINNNITNKI